MLAYNVYTSLEQDIAKNTFLTFKMDDFDFNIMRTFQLQFRNCN